MVTRASLLRAACLLPLLSSCASPAEEPKPVMKPPTAAPQSITYVGKQSITNFAGYGQQLQYWPLFGLTSAQTAQRTDAPGCIELTPSFANFTHHYLFAGRTFSNDALGV